MWFSCLNHHLWNISNGMYYSEHMVIFRWCSDADGHLKLWDLGLRRPVFSRRCACQVFQCESVLCRSPSSLSLRTNMHLRNFDNNTTTVVDHVSNRCAAVMHCEIEKNAVNWWGDRVKVRSKVITSQVWLYVNANRLCSTSILAVQWAGQDNKIIIRCVSA